MTEFTPLASTFGGALIGLASVLLMAMNGRIAGISGITVNILPPWGTQVLDGDLSWRFSFVLGLMVAPLGVQAISDTPIQQTVSSNVALMVIAGLLTGFGAVYGGGCTSGHGVCGMSRLSMRSIVATLSFMATGVITVFVMRHVVGG